MYTTYYEIFENSSPAAPRMTANCRQIRHFSSNSVVGKYLFTYQIVMHTSRWQCHNRTNDTDSLPSGKTAAVDDEAAWLYIEVF